MSLEGMRHFMADHGGQAVFILGNLQNPREDRDLSTGQGKRVDRAIVSNDRKFPLIFRFIRDGGDPIPHPVDQLIQLRIVAYRCFPKQLPIGAHPHCHFFFFGNVNKLIPCRPRSSHASAHDCNHGSHGPHCQKTREPHGSANTPK